MAKTTIIAKSLKDAFQKARSRYRGNLVVANVKRKEIVYEITTKMRIKHPRKR